MGWTDTQDHDIVKTLGSRPRAAGGRSVSSSLLVVLSASTDRTMSMEAHLGQAAYISTGDKIG